MNVIVIEVQIIDNLVLITNMKTILYIFYSFHPYLYI